MEKYRQRVYINKEGKKVSDRYTFYKADKVKPITLEKDLTLDEISYKYYGTPLYYWVIGEANNIADPFVKLKKGMNVKVPII